MLQFKLGVKQGVKQGAFAAGLLLAGLAAPAQAVIIGGIEFPQGAISFADKVET